MINSLFPSWVELYYHSLQGPHVMTLPTREWVPPTPGNVQGSYLAWDDSTIDANTMIQAFADVLKARLEAGGAVDNYIIKTKATPESETVFGAAAPIITGSGIQDTIGRIVPAVQLTVNYLDSEGSRVKLTILDTGVLDFQPISNFEDLEADMQALVSEWTDTTKAWASRNGARPTTFRRITTTLNEKLRRAYRMG